MAPDCMIFPDKNISQLIQLFRDENLNNNQAGDATWILTSAFLIFTMQSGFGLLEAGSCSGKNECNIMVKNAVDVIFGALAYFICGFGFSFGIDPSYSNEFTGFGYFLGNIEDKNGEIDGHMFAKYFFQLSFATTATTIVSGAMAERTKLKSYMLFSFLNCLSYVFPAHWIWDEKGYFFKRGVVDIAGCGPVHIVGGVSALVATVILKPRLGIFDGKEREPMASPTNVVLGTFMLWWGWLGFNCGSTFGVSGGKWKLASKAALITINGSAGGATWVIFYCYVCTKKFDGKLDVGTFTGGILAGLVSITSICAICRPWEAIIIGFIGGIIFTYGCDLLLLLKIDDPVFCIPVHFFCAVWGVIVVGFVGEKDTIENLSRSNGVLKGGPASFLGYQALSVICITAWAAITTAVELLLIDVTVGLRMSKEDEILGADMTEHGIYDPADTLVFGNQKSVRREISLIRKDTKESSCRSYSKKGATNFGFVSIKKRITNENLEDEHCNGGTLPNDNNGTKKIENNTMGTWKVLLENSFIDE